MRRVLLSHAAVPPALPGPFIRDTFAAFHHRGSLVSSIPYYYSRSSVFLFMGSALPNLHENFSMQRLSCQDLAPLLTFFFKEFHHFICIIDDKIPSVLFPYGLGIDRYFLICITRSFKNQGIQWLGCIRITPLSIRTVAVIPRFLLHASANRSAPRPQSARIHPQT